MAHRNAAVPCGSASCCRRRGPAGVAGERGLIVVPFPMQGAIEVTTSEFQAAARRLDNLLALQAPDGALSLHLIEWQGERPVRRDHEVQKRVGSLRWVDHARLRHIGEPRAIVLWRYARIDPGGGGAGRL